MELQHIFPSGSSHFRTIERQDSFELDLEPVISCGRGGSVTVIRPQPRTLSQDPDSRTMQNTTLAEEKNFHNDRSTPSDLSKSCVSSVKTNVDTAQTPQSTLMAQENRGSPSSASLINSTDYLDSKNSTVGVAHVSTVIETICKDGVVSATEPGNEQKQLIHQREDCTVTTTCPSSTESTNLKQQGALSEQSEQGLSSSAPLSEGDSEIVPCADGGEEGSGPGVMDGSDRGSLTNKTASKVELRAAASSWTAPEVLVNSSEASSKKEHQGKKKGILVLLLLILLLFYLMNCSSLHLD